VAPNVVLYISSVLHCLHSRIPLNLMYRIIMPASRILAGFFLIYFQAAKIPFPSDGAMCVYAARALLIRQ